jgi:hypothetical protein
VQLADTAGELQGFADFAVNDSGDVIFGAGLDAGGQSIRVSDGTVTQTLATTTGAFAPFVNPSLNNRGDFAFLGRLDSGELGSFGGADAIDDLIIKSGDLIFGKEVLNVGASSLYAERCWASCFWIHFHGQVASNRSSGPSYRNATTHHSRALGPRTIRRRYHTSPPGFIAFDSTTS